MIRNAHRFLLIALVFCICSCDYVLKPSNISKTEESHLVDSISIEMQSKIDSATAICDSALLDFKNGENGRVIKKRYGNQISSLEKQSIKIFQYATDLYENEEISQQSYDEIRDNVFADSIQAKVKRLKSYGITF